MSSDVKLGGLDGCALPQIVHDHVDAERVARVRAHSPSEADLTRLTSVFRLLGDPTRARLLYALLGAGEVCVCVLAAATDVQDSTVSQALRLLRASGVVTGWRSGRLAYYRLADAHVRMLLDISREHVRHDGDSVGQPHAGPPR